MKSKTILLIIALAVIVIGGIYAVTRKEPAPASTAETAAPAAAPAEKAPVEAAPAADGMAGTDANVPANQPTAQECTQYSWDGAKWVCTSGAPVGN